jgi:endonuclease/exonuclease/phosphatase family metal-dependent hydrolase
MENDRSIKLITLNIERSKHLDLVLPFLAQEQPDVLCVQELCAADIDYFRTVMGEYHCTAPLAIHNGESNNCLFSLGIFTRYPIKASEVLYHHGNQDELPQFIPGDQNTINRALLRCDMEKDGEVFRIGTTHFAWTADGEVDDTQRREIEELLHILEKQGELVFTGDFNAPRGKEIYSRLAEQYRDNIPPEYTTSIDGIIHRAGVLPLMVDSIFSTPSYIVQHVRQVCGVSDHCAFVAEVRKVG